MGIRKTITGVVRNYFLLDLAENFLRFNREKELMSDRLLPWLGGMFFIAAAALFFIYINAYEVARGYPNNWPGLVGAYTLFSLAVVFVGAGYFIFVVWYKAPPHGEN